MTYKYAKGKIFRGDIYNEDDAERNTYIDFGSDDYIGLVASGSSVLVVSGSKVGIGTASPTTTLHAYAEVSDAYVALIDNDDSSAAHGLKVTSDGNGSGTYVLDLEAKSTTLFRVRGDGRVGIGKVTSLPAACLTVSGSTYGDADIAVASKIQHIGDSDTYIEFEDDTLTFTAGGRSFLKLEETSQDKLIINHGGLNIDLKVSGQNQPNLIRTDAANDKVGIGVGEPSHTLTVGGNISASINISASSFYGDGSNLSNVGGGGSPGGSDTQVQFNNSDSFDGDAKFTWNDTTAELAVASLSSSTHISASVVHIYGEIHFEQSAKQTSDFTIAAPIVPLYRVDTASGVVTASLPLLAAEFDGMWLNIKDVGLSASTNNVVVEPSGSDTIDGATSLKIQANGGSVGLQADHAAARWYIVFTN